MEKIATFCFVSLAASVLFVASSPPSEKLISKRDTPVFIPPKRCRADEGERLPPSARLVSMPGVPQLEECLLLCSYMALCTSVHWSDKACELYKTPRDDMDISKRLSSNELIHLLKDGSAWYSNVQCDTIDIPIFLTTSTMSTRAPDDLIYFLPGHQCLGKRLDGGFSTHDRSIKIMDAGRPKTVEDCVNFCFLWGNCTAVIFEAGKICRAFHRSIAQEPGFELSHSGRMNDAVLIYDICCDDEDCRLPYNVPELPSTTRKIKVSTPTTPATTSEEIEELEETEQTTTEGVETTRAGIVVVNPPKETPEPETEEPETITFEPPTAAYQPSSRVKPESACFKCTYNRTTIYDDLQILSQPLVQHYKAGSTVECLMACHFRKPDCLAIAMHKEACNLLLKPEYGHGTPFTNSGISFFAHKIKCQMKSDDDDD